MLPPWLFLFSLLELFINLYITALYNSGHRTTSQNFQFLYIFCKVDLYIAVTLYITVTFPRVTVVHRFDFTIDNDIRLNIPSLWCRQSTKYLKCTRYISIVNFSNAAYLSNSECNAGLISSRCIGQGGGGLWGGLGFAGAPLDS